MTQIFFICIKKAFIQLFLPFIGIFYRNFMQFSVDEDF